MRDYERIPSLVPCPVKLARRVLRSAGKDVQFTTFYVFSPLFDTYLDPAKYVCAGLIQVGARIRRLG